MIYNIGVSFIFIKIYTSILFINENTLSIFCNLLLHLFKFFRTMCKNVQRKIFFHKFQKKVQKKSSEKKFQNRPPKKFFAIQGGQI
jgi:hypothetical protein